MEPTSRGVEPQTSGPAPVRCPVIRRPEAERCDPADLDPLLARLRDPTPVGGDETFRRGTLRADGRLDLCKQGLGPEGARRVLPAATRSPHATHLLLGTNALGAEGARALADALDGDHGLDTLYLGCNGIDAAGAAALFDRLAGDRGVRALWLKRNPLGDEGARRLAAALRRNHTIRTLDLVNTGLTLNGLRALAGALAARSRAVERLFLGGNGLGPEAADVLAGLLLDGGVRELFLAANQLGDRGAAALAAACTRGGRRQALGVGGNGVGPAGVRALAEALGALEALDLGRPPSQRALGAPPNRVADTGAAALAAALPRSALRRLDLRHTAVTGRGARLLLAAVQQGTVLERLALGPGVPRRVKAAIAPHLRPTSGPHRDVRAIGSVYR